MEEFRIIKGYENYEVSNLGKVRRKECVTIYKDGRKAMFSSNELKQSKCNKGYFRVFLSTNSKKTTIRVHQLVAIAFLSYKTNGMELVVDHIDENKLNNHSDNLQIITNRENVSKSKKNFTSKYTGVSFDKSRNKWTAEIRIGKIRKRLGRFINEIDAYNAYQKELNGL